MTDNLNSDPASGGQPAGAGAEGAGAKASAAAGTGQPEPKGGGDKAGGSLPAGSAAADADKSKADPGKPDAGKANGLSPDLVKLLERVPEAYRGKDVSETLDRLLDSQKGFREHIAKHGLAPADAAEYAYKPTEKLAADFFTGGEQDQKLVSAVLDVFKNEGVGKLQGARLLNGILENVVQTFDLQPAINTEAERAQLLPVDALGLSDADKKAAIEARINTAVEFTRTLERHGMPAKAVDQLASLTDTAGGIMAIEFIMNLVRGDGLALNGALGGQAQELADLEKARASDQYRDNPKYRLDVQNRILALKGVS